jgi:hypothetical protein
MMLPMLLRRWLLLLLWPPLLPVLLRDRDLFDGLMP